MVKACPIGAIHAGTVHPGKYLVLVRGDTASVEIALEVGSGAGGANLLATVFLPDIHRDVFDALVSPASAAELVAEALGIVETADVASVIDAADAGAKAADVTVASVRLADGLGGKGYVLFSGTVAEVEAALDAASIRIGTRGSLVRSDLIAQLHEEMAANLASELRFAKRMVAGG